MNAVEVVPWTVALAERVSDLLLSKGGLFHLALPNRYVRF
jgi:hypothetical protein